MAFLFFFFVIYAANADTPDMAPDMSNEVDPESYGMKFLKKATQELDSPNNFCRSFSPSCLCQPAASQLHLLPKLKKTLLRLSPASASFPRANMPPIPTSYTISALGLWHL